MRPTIRSEYSVVFFISICIPLFSDASRADTPSKINFNDEIFGKLSAEERDLLLEYETNYRVLKRFYENSSIFASYNIYDYTTGESNQDRSKPAGSVPTLRQARELEWRANCSTKEGEYLRVDDLLTYFSSPEGIVEGIPSGFVRRTIGIANPTDAYLLRKEKEDAEYYTLLGTQKVAHGYATPNYYRYPCAAFAPWGMPLEHQLFRKPGFAEQNKLDYAIVYVRSVQEEAENIVVIKAEVHNPTTNGHGEYTFKFLRDHSWAVKDVVYDGTEGSRRSTCAYKGETEGVPLLKTLFYELEKAKTDGGGLVWKEEFIVTTIIPGSVPLKEFEVQQFLPLED